MTDIAVEKKTYLPSDRPWLLFTATGPEGPVPTTDGTLNFALFTANTHYPNGFIPSGVALGKVTTGGRIGPYDNAASDGRQTCIGFLYNSTPVPADTARKVQAAIVDCFAIVSEARLPTGHGLDTAGKAELPLVKFRA